MGFHECLTLPLSGRQGACGGDARGMWWPDHSRGLLDLLGAELSCDRFKLGKIKLKPIGRVSIRGAIEK